MQRVKSTKNSAENQTNTPEISGGFYIKARKIQDSEIATAPPHIREIFDWLLKEANHSDSPDGKIKRGQTLRSYKDIQEGLHWRIGFRKQYYTKWQIENAMKYYMKHQMVTTMKTTRGMIITICNYDTYQNPKNYERHNESHNSATITPHDKQEEGRIIKNVKKETAKKDFIDEIVNVFLNAYQNEFSEEYTITNQGKERSAAGKLVKLYRQKFPNATSQDTIQALGNYFAACCRVNDAWYRNNMSLTIIHSKFNELNKILKNNGNGKSNGTTERQLAEILIKHFGEEQEPVDLQRSAAN